MEKQVYQKILEHIWKARKQLSASAQELACSTTLYACVINWFEHSIHLDEESYQLVVNWLEKDSDQESLIGVDGVFFISKFGQTFLFLNETKDIHGRLAIPKDNLS